MSRKTLSQSEEFLKQEKERLRKALSYLQESHKKIVKLSADPVKFNDETLEKWESYVARFARVSDMFITRYLKHLILKEDPAFRGSVRDLLNTSEKLGFIESADTWLDIRELRNKATHEYSETDLQQSLIRIRDLTPFLVKEISSNIGLDAS